MSRSVALALTCLTLFLLLFPLAVWKPGLPATLKADEPAYYLSALSLGRDGDLKYELKDQQRLFDEYPYRSVSNLILMTDDQWNTVYYGKPFIYPLFAAPLAVLFGANGMVTFNMLLIAAMIWMGTLYLRQHNTDSLAALVATGFFLFSTTYAYGFWLQPEIFNMAAGMTCLFLVFHEPAKSCEDSRWTWLWTSVNGRRVLSGAALALAIYNKPVMAAFALPVFVGDVLRYRWRTTVAFVLGGVIMIGLLSGFSIALTGHPSAYLGVARVGVTVQSPDVFPLTAGDLTINRGDERKNSWYWIFRIPDIEWKRLLANVKYFLVGRHTGLLVYMPFGVFALAMFAFFERRSPTRWAVIAALASVAVFFLIWIPFNWHGGGGFVGNRYFANVYPAFLFLITRIRPFWSPAIAYGVASLLLGPMIFTPFGAPVVNPTLQAHVRGAFYKHFPLEMTIRSKIPGYKGVTQSGIWFLGRQDMMRLDRDELWIHGAEDVELWAFAQQPIERAVFHVRSVAGQNDIEIRLGKARERISLSRQQRSGRLELAPGPPRRVLYEDGAEHYVYPMTVSPRTGYPISARSGSEEVFYLGAALIHLGTPEELDSDLYQLEWGECETPSEVAAGQRFEIVTRLKNTSRKRWPAKGVTRVSLSYHWLDPSGAMLVRDGKRTALRKGVNPNRSARVVQSVIAPSAAGSYTLALDLVRENVAWFSDRNSTITKRIPVEVVAGVSAEAAN